MLQPFKPMSELALNTLLLTEDISQVFVWILLRPDVHKRFTPDMVTPWSDLT